MAVVKADFARVPNMSRNKKEELVSPYAAELLFSTFFFLEGFFIVTFRNRKNRVRSEVPKDYVSLKGLSTSRQVNFVVSS